MGIHDPPREREVFLRGRERAVGRLELARVDERLPVEAHIATLPARRLEPRLVVEIEVDAIDRESPRLLERARIRGRHVQDAAAWANGLGQGSPPGVRSAS